MGVYPIEGVPVYTHQYGIYYAFMYTNKLITNNTCTWVGAWGTGAGSGGGTRWDIGGAGSG